MPSVPRLPSRAAARQRVPRFPLLLALGAAALAASPARAAAPVISDIGIDAPPANAWSALIYFKTDVPARSDVIVHADEPGLRRESFVVPASGKLTPSPGRDHFVVALGLRPQVPYHFTLRAAGEDGAVGDFSTESIGAYTPGMPEYFTAPQYLEVVRSNPRRMAPGVTIFPLLSADFFAPELNAVLGYAAALDARGRWVWYNATPLRGTAADIEPLSNGNLVILEGDPSDASPAIVERNAVGDVVNVWAAKDYGLRTAHHAVTELPKTPEQIAQGAEYGNFVFLSTEARTIGGYTLSDEVDCTTCNVVGDLVVEIDPNARTLVRKHSTFDFLPALYRIKPNFADRGFDVSYPEYIDGTLSAIGTRDYTHGNAVVLDPLDDSFVVSLRHQDAVVKIDRATGALKWVLGEDDPGTPEDDGWPFIQLTGPSVYPNHQHDPTILPSPDLPEGWIRVLLFDNGNARAQFDLDDLPVTQAAVYDIDQTNLVGHMSAAFPDPDYPRGGFTPFVGSAQLLAESGTVLVNNGAFTVDPPKAKPDPGEYYTHIVEYAAGDKEKVFEVKIGEARAAQKRAYTSYRAIRLPSLYPKVGPCVGGVPVSTGALGFEVELQNIVNGRSVQDNWPGVAVQGLRAVAGL